jgi:hypothetical protein
MTRSILIELEVPEDLARLTMPPALKSRLETLLDKQDREGSLTEEERREAESLVDLSEILSLLKLRARRAVAQGDNGPAR